MSDVLGLAQQKEILTKNIIRPLTIKGSNFAKGVLLFGAPGVGKTLIAKAVASSAPCSYFQVYGHDFRLQKSP
jgi:ATP-dependent 26S proteasome regulatory subunit